MSYRMDLYVIFKFKTTNFIQMKKHTLLLLISYLSYIPITHSQTFKSTDGKTIEIVSMSGKANDIQRLSISLGVFYLEGPKFIGVHYLIPKKYYFNFDYGKTSYLGDMNYFIKSWEKKDTISQSLAFEGNTRYVGRLPVTYGRSFGIHYGGGFFKETEFNSDIQSHSIFLGTNISIKNQTTSSVFKRWFTPSRKCLKPFKFRCCMLFKYKI